MFSPPENSLITELQRQVFFLFVSQKHIPFCGIPFYAAVMEIYLKITELCSNSDLKIFQESFQQLFQRILYCSTDLTLKNIIQLIQPEFPLQQTATIASCPLLCSSASL